MRKTLIILIVVPMVILAIWFFYVGFVGLGWWLLNRADIAGPVDWSFTRWLAVFVSMFVGAVADKVAKGEV